MKMRYRLIVTDADETAFYVDAEFKNGHLVRTRFLPIVANAAATERASWDAAHQLLRDIKICYPKMTSYHIEAFK